VTETPQQYDLTFRPAALRSLRKLDRQVAARIKTATEALRDDPRPSGVKMRLVRIADVGHRGDIYR
jgi:mRNA-degrading endonuclease RelE of RelBE toxin-antitoxin system